MSSPLYTVALVGARGYAGQVLHALLMHHPTLEVIVVDAREPSDASATQLAAWAGCDAAMLAVPEAPAEAWVAALQQAGAKRILDLSGAHRLRDDVHYGLPELFGAPAPHAKLVANPGCYPTATLLALKPLLDADVIADHHIAVVGASGTSGAGKGLAPHLHFSELHDNFFPYKVGQHRHTPEIERYLGAPISFVTELLPIVRGILITAFVAAEASPAVLRETLEHAYAPHPHVTVLAEPGLGLGVRHVVGTHQAIVAVGPVERSGLVPVFAAIDNLMRGAASQALCNLNLWLGLEPHLGLPPVLTHDNDVPGMKGTIT